MNIILFPSAYHPAVGGVEVLTANLARTLRRNGHGVEVWTYASDGEAAVDEVDGITVRRFAFDLPSKSTMRPSFVRDAARTFKSMWDAAARFDPDVLHVQCFSGNGAFAAALAAARRRPLIVTLQGETIMDDHAIYDRSVVLRAALRMASRNSYVTTGCSQFTLDDAVQRVGIRPKRMEVIFNGVDLDVVEEPVALPQRPFFAALGRVVRNKGFDLLLDAYEAFAATENETDLVIGGTGSELDALKRRCEETGLGGRVHFIGRLRPGQVATVMRTSIALAVPSRVEPFGIVVLEGWRAGVPVIVTSSGGPQEFVQDGVTGLVVDPHDRVALTEALTGLAGDSSLRQRLGAAGRAQISEFSWGSITAEYERLYDASRSTG